MIKWEINERTEILAGLQLRLDELAKCLQACKERGDRELYERFYCRMLANMSAQNKIFEL